MGSVASYLCTLMQSYKIYRAAQYGYSQQLREKKKLKEENIMPDKEGWHAAVHRVEHDWATELTLGFGFVWSWQDGWDGKMKDI